MKLKAKWKPKSKPTWSKTRKIQQDKEKEQRQFNMQGINYKAKTKKTKNKQANLQREYNERLTKGREEIE